MAIARWEELKSSGTPTSGVPGEDKSGPPLGTPLPKKWQDSASRPDGVGQAQLLRFVGSHDLAVELLPQLLTHRSPGLVLSLEYAGSLGGLIALARKEADLAGIHLWDAASNGYNVPFVQRILPGQRVVLLTLFHRSMGLMVRPGNPGQLKTVADLTNPDVHLINRQAGSGTRVWLDAQIRALGKEPEAIPGYSDVESTHLAVARRIAEGGATVGLGIQAAAAAYGLDFVPLTQERYDLVMPHEIWNTAPARSLVEVVRSPEFRNTVLTLGGYNLTATGQEVWLE